MSLVDFKFRIMVLDDRLRPIAHRAVDITEPGWASRLMNLPYALDEAGVRPEVESLLNELFVVYETTDSQTRQTMRKCFEEYRAFARAASLAAVQDPEEDFRRQLLLFSLKDQERDSRDALLWL